MSERMEDLEHSATWIRGLVLLSETPGYRPAAMSYVTPSEYRQRAEDLLARYATALATETAKREQAERDAAYVALRLGEIDDSYVGRYSVTSPLHFNIADGRDGWPDTTLAEADSLAELGARLRAITDEIP